MSSNVLRLLQLTSPALPIGAFAYSRGLESAAEQGWVRTEAELLDWLVGTMRMSLARSDIPALMAAHRTLQNALESADLDIALEAAATEVKRLSSILLASRETRELWLEDRQLGQALARVLDGLELESARSMQSWPELTLMAPFALAAAHYGVSADDAVLGYLYMFAENQVTAALRLLPIGQTQGQRVLSKSLDIMPEIADAARSVRESEWGNSTFGLALGSALHETQYSRMFRS